MKLTDYHAKYFADELTKRILSRSEWGHDDYSLKVENLPKAPPPPTAAKTEKIGQQNLL